MVLPAQEVIREELRGITREEALRRSLKFLSCHDEAQACVDATRIMSNAPDEYVRYLEQSGCHRLSVEFEGLRIGTVWISVHGDVAHVAGAVCSSQNFSACDVFMPKVEALALALGKSKISMVTARPGLIKKLSDQGYGLIEARLIKSLQNGQL
jgi:hypothetical protein